MQQDQSDTSPYFPGHGAQENFGCISFLRARTPYPRQRARTLVKKTTKTQGRPPPFVYYGEARKTQKTVFFRRRDLGSIAVPHIVRPSLVCACELFAAPLSRLSDIHYLRSSTTRIHKKGRERIYIRPLAGLTKPGKRRVVKCSKDCVSLAVLTAFS